MSTQASLGIPGLRDAVALRSGGFATVHRAYQARFGRVVAVKVLHVQNLDQQALRRFERECQIMGELSAHPHVLTLYDADIDPDGHPYLITEFCEQGSLADSAAREGRLAPDEVIGIGRALTDALAYAHERDILHRDVKPANVLVTNHGAIALADFGLSIRLDLGASRGLDAFTPQHAAPESLGEGEYTVASDLYSLGSTLYALLEGRPPLPQRRDEPPGSTASST